MSKLGDIAQLVERGLCKADVRSSSLLISINKNKKWLEKQVLYTKPKFTMR
jgi:hypothetical protein